MYSRLLDKLTALLLAAQLLVLPAVLAPHQHEHVSLEAHAGLHGCHSHCHEHHHATGDPRGTEDPPPAQHSHDDCRICQFLAQSALAPALTTAEALFAQVESLSCRDVVVATAPQLTLPPARAPPATV